MIDWENYFTTYDNELISLMYKDLSQTRNKRSLSR